MNKINSYNKKIIIIISLILILSLYSTSLLSEANIDEDDGIYFIDIFDDSNDFELVNCTISKEKGKIILDPFTSTTRTYDYTDWNIDSDDRAYSYTFFGPLPPRFGINYYENEFDGDVDYNLIKSKNNIFYPLNVVYEPLFLQGLRKIHHFRLKIDENTNFTSKLNIYWCGKAENDLKITLYYWQQAVGSIGLWHEAASGVSNSSVIEIQQNFTGDLFIDEDNFIDFCLVATPLQAEACSIFTDYVKVNTYGQGSSYYGHLISDEINPDYLDRWEFFSWGDYEKTDTSIKYHILYKNSTGDFNLIDDSYLPGNEFGFTSSPVYLEDIPLYDIKILANLSTNDPLISPEIDSLSLSWQTNNNIWRDRFSSILRVDQIDNVIISDGEVKLLLSVNDWLMFGNNPANIRSTDSYGPDINNHSLYWYTTTLCGGGYKNPVLNNNVLHIASIDGDKIYSFNATIPQGDEGSTVIPLKQVEIPVNTIESTPAMTKDGKLIVVSGTTSNDGDIDNKIFAYNVDDTISDSPIWEFNYSEVDEDNPYICYSASPTIYEDIILISSWSGKDSIWNSLWNYFNFSSGNNKLIALDFDGNLKWVYDLPAGSFSSPAVFNDVVVIGCENSDGNSIFAIDVKNGEKIWDNNIGSVGRNSPLIYDDKVFVTVKEMGVIPFTGYERVIALDLNDGSEIWNLSIGDDIADNYEKIGVASSSIYDDYLFTVSADGTLYSIDIENGEEEWSEKIYSKSIISSYYLSSSPVCTKDMIYVGTPDGILYAFYNNGTVIWQENSYDNSPIQNSPIIVDGIIYYNSENGMLYSRGDFKQIEDEVITGSIISSPIYKTNPNYKWNKFFADYETEDGKIEFFILDKYENILLDDITDESNISKSNVNNKDIIRLRADFSANYSSNNSGLAILKDWRVTFGDDDYDAETIFYDSSFYSSGDPPICKIDVQNKYIGLLDNAEFRVKYEQDTDEYTSTWYDAEFSGNDGTLDRETITADISDINIADDNTIFLEIQFRIYDFGEDNNESKSQWYEIEYDTPDIQPPIFFEDTFAPEEGWISIQNPISSINVKDEGTKGNISGLNVASAEFNFQYKDSTTFRSKTGKATTTGVNATIETITLTADLSDINNIVEFRQIRFYIEDMAGNIKYSNYFDFETDNEKPYSWIINTDEIPSKSNISSIRIDAEAEDNLSGINYVDLFYSKENSSWKKFKSDLTEPYSWNFTITKTIGGGFFELCTISTDLANNIEDFPNMGDISFIYDPIDPWINIPKNEYEFNISDIVPSFDDIEFIDDYKLKKVEYRLDFYDLDEWIQINDEDLNNKSYVPSWNLSKQDWDYLVEDVPYNIYFRITDSLDNIYETSSTKDPVKVIKNLEIDIIKSPYDPDISDLDSLNWDNIYKIFVEIDENEVSEITLLYRFSQNDKNWTDWMQYGELINSSPFEWEFRVDNGSGFYEFKTSVLDPAGIYVESEIQSIELILFPVYQIIALVISIIFLLIITTLIIKKLKNR